MYKPVDPSTLDAPPPRQTNNAGVYVRAFKAAMDIPADKAGMVAVEIEKVIDAEGAEVLGPQLLEKAGRHLRSWLSRQSLAPGALELKTDSGTGSVFVFNAKG